MRALLSTSVDKRCIKVAQTLALARCGRVSADVSTDMCVLRHPCSCVTLCAFIVEAYMDMTYIVMAHTVMAPLMHWLCARGARMHAAFRVLARVRVLADLSACVSQCFACWNVRARACVLPPSPNRVWINSAGRLRALLSTGAD